MSNQRGLRANRILCEDMADRERILTEAKQLFGNDTDAIIQKAMHDSESTSATFKDCLQNEINKKKAVCLIQSGDIFYVAKQTWEEMTVNRSQFIIVKTIKQRNIPISWFERLKFWKWIEKEIVGYLVEFVGKTQETSSIYEVSTAFESFSKACGEVIESFGNLNNSLNKLKEERNDQPNSANNV